MREVDWSAQFNPPTQGMLNSVLRIWGTDLGAAFQIEVDEKLYILTAAHLVVPETTELRVFYDGGWIAIEVKVLAYTEKDDIAVLRPSVTPVRTDLKVKIGSDGLHYGQHVYFLGFPYGDFGQITAFDDGKRPLPYVKWGAVSMINHVQSNLVVLDGSNNPGFSGGPVVFNLARNEQYIVGMIIGLKEEERFVERFDGRKDENKLLYKQNTGLIYVADEKAILGLIRACPNGLPVPEISKL